MVLLVIIKEIKRFLQKTSPPIPPIKWEHAKEEQRGDITPGLSPAQLLHPTPAPNASGATPELAHS